MVRVEKAQHNKTVEVCSKAAETLGYKMGCKCKCNVYLAELEP